MAKYDASLDSKQYRAIYGGVAYVNPFSGLRYHLTFHQAIHMPDLGHHFMCPMQFRANGIKVNNCPCMLCDDPHEKSHTAVATDYGEDLVIPFFLSGGYSIFKCGTLNFERV